MYELSKCLVDGWRGRHACSGAVSGRSSVKQVPSRAPLATADLPAQQRGDDVVADRQPQAAAALAQLGGEEGVEDAAQVLGRDAAAVVGEAHQHPAVAGQRGRSRICPMPRPRTRAAARC